MGRWIQNIILYSFVLLCAACQDNNCFKGAGETRIILKNLDDFDYVMLYDNISVTIFPDSVNYAEIKAGDNIIDDITFNYLVDTLIIKNESSCPWSKGYDYSINMNLHCDVFHWFYYKGSGDINFADTIKQYWFAFVSFKSSGTVHLLLDVGMTSLWNYKGTADFYYHGFCEDQLLIHNEASGIVNTLDMPSTKVVLNQFSTNDSYISVIETFVSEIEWVGNVYYTGNPDSINNTETHKGKLIKLSDESIIDY